MTIDIEEHGPNALTPGDWKKLVQMLKRQELARLQREQVEMVLGDDLIAVIMAARLADGRTLAQIQ